ncbi:MAG TPA: class II aldolase/adducin family protein [Terracidiphilus sp.]|nr:class II aldolase/adducin family protein [Terracidiphilus sp.]
MTQQTIPMAEQMRDAQELSAQDTARSAEACCARSEILEVGRKLWERGYVDGNGGNISVRVGPRYLLCTPTMISKRDMQPEDLCLADLEGTILVGDRPRTSELLLHLEIYKANPRARAVVHCHPPHATAWAVVGEAPPNGYVTEFELMVGPVAVAPYETPGTQCFAETVIPFVEDHNTILLENHGIVCWADTATHAEWLVEIVDTYCKTLSVAQQIGKPLKQIPEAKIEELLQVKRRMGLPDARLGHRAAVVEMPATDAELDKIVEEELDRLEERG